MRIGTIFLLAALSYTLVAAQEKSDRDTVYLVAPVTVTATQATERLSPVTFSNIRRSDIVQQYTTQDAPALLSSLPSITFYSENGNASGGYSYINLRGFEQQRLSVMVNGVPQNDPEDFSVYGSISLICLEVLPTFKFSAVPEAHSMVLPQSADQSIFLRFHINRSQV